MDPSIFSRLLEAYGWLVAVSVVLAAAIALHFAIGLLLEFWGGHWERRRGKRTILRSLPLAITLPLRVLIWIMAATIVLQILPLDLGRLQESGFITKVQRLAVVVCGLMFLMRWKSAALIQYRAGAEWGGTRLDRGTIDGVGKLITLAILLFGLLLILRIFGVDLMAVVTLGGFGTLALGFAGKDVISNFFAGLMLYFTRPFVVGDLITVPDKAIEGNVEAIGWYLTEVRAPDHRSYYLPNSLFSSAVVINGSRGLDRRVETTLGLRYDDFEELVLIATALRAMLSSHPAVNQSTAPIVRFNKYGESSLDLYIRVYTYETEYDKFLSAQESLLLEMGRIVKQHGADFAFPTTRLELPPIEIVPFKKFP